MNLRKLFSRFTLSALASATLMGGSAQADVIVVDLVGLSFLSADVTINVGDTVRWNRTAGSHTVTEGTDGALNGNEAFHSPMNSAVPVFEVVFDAAFLAANPRVGNVYPYQCLPHWAFGMVGTVTVEEEPGTSFCDCSSGNAPCGNSGAAGAGCANSTFVGATLSASGSASATTDDISFVCTGLPSNKPTLLFFGTAQQNGGAGSPFGDGLRCAGGAIQRLNVVFSSATGESNWGSGLNAGLWNAGDTRHFQVWYRDPNNGPCGNGFNVSNGYSVTFN